jgi:alanine dehydrogenase
MDLLTLGVLGTSTKENERRLPIHPAHIDRIDADLRAKTFLEQGYGANYGVSDAHLAPQVAGMLPRDELIATADVVLLPKPTLADVTALRDGQVLWGWPHAVQDAPMTQLAIDKRLTLIAWEAMNHWTADGSFMVHVFHMNNELAGYSSVLHSLSLEGTTGHYGRQLSAAVIGFGNTARGAITGLQALVVNCVLQDTDAPLMFVSDDELGYFTPGSLFVDVSCDLGMGFACARPTSFEEPTFQVGDGITYYGVDHSPAYLWNSATWGISEALIPYLRPVMGGPAAWEQDVTIRLAIEIHQGVVQNPKILSFQRRATDHPHHHL